MTRLSTLGKFIVYGVGIKTESLINTYGSQIVGLMDKEKVGESIYGKRVLSDSEVAESCIKVIVIASRQANVAIIYRRIAAFCTENGIIVYDTEGNQIERQISGEILDFQVSDTKEIKDQIDRADIVSFDVFDTLIMRSCLYPDDVFEIAGTRNTIDEYGRIFEIENELAQKRKEAAALYEYAAFRNKPIYLVSDMYLVARDMNVVLNKCGIHTNTSNILVSKEWGVSKEDGLFDILKSRCGLDKKIVHIGDSYEADYVAAKKYGINSIKITNRLEVLENSENASILEFDTTLENRLVIGQLLVSDLALADFISPLIYKFVSWLKEKATEFDIILLGARDGWLIDLIRKTIPQYHIPAVYFLTSRTAAVSAGIFDQKDIESAKKYPFSGSNLALNEKRFAVKNNIDDQELLMHTARLRNNYLKYIDSLNIPKSARVGFMDFVTAGTCYRALKKFMPFELKGLFTMNLSESSNEVEALYPKSEQTAAIKNYFLIEETLCSSQPTLMCFDDNGNPLYFEEKRSKAQICRLERLQEEILKYGQRTKNIDFSKVDLSLCDYIFGMAKETAVSAEDEFCGR